MQDLQDKVRALISKARTKEAIVVIETWASKNGNKDAKDTITLIKANWETLKREERMGCAGSG